jgi:hypothetical protein
MRKVLASIPSFPKNKSEYVQSGVTSEKTKRLISEGKATIDDARCYYTVA